MQNTTITMLRKCSQAIARVVMPEKAWAYYSSAADDEITNRENHAAYHRIWWRPRILLDVTNVDWSTTILGHASKMPLYIVCLMLGSHTDLGADRSVADCNRAWQAWPSRW